LDIHNYVEQVAEQSTIARGTFDVPFIRQFAGTIPYVYQLQNMVVWGMGLLAGISALIGFCWLTWQSRRPEYRLWLIVLSWIAIYVAITGSFYVKFMRYMLPVYPLLSVVAAVALFALIGKLRWSGESSPARFDRYLPTLRRCLLGIVLVGTIFQGLALLNVYSSPNTRVQASRWIYAHIAEGSVLTYEQWDDPLPVAVDGNDPAVFKQATYTVGGQTVTGLDLYGDDTLQKAQQLAQLLPTLNAITMATDRLDKSIPRLPTRYPLTIRYYQLLYSGQLGFHLAAQFENHPHLLGITLDDSNADESYSVFDHPTSRVFVRTTPYPYTSEQLLQKLLDGVHLPPANA
jgi:predicted membrane channel-forming protein YqfA (hemolysin III family)